MITKEQKKIFIIAAVFIAIAIFLGAFATHNLKKIISEEKLISFEVGVRYQIYHGFALLFFGMLMSKCSFSFNKMVNLILIGVIFFSGSIYLFAIQELFNLKLSSFLWPITPIGGILLISSWLIFIIKISKEKINSSIPK
jgi:uncharacterized membrane protein YgdD (TMEM256/DUF423 family)